MSELASVTRWLYYYSVFGHYINDYLPTSIKTPNLVQKFAKYEKATQKIPKDFLNFAIVTKFCQIWSHWNLHLKCQNCNF